MPFCRRILRFFIPVAVLVTILIIVRDRPPLLKLIRFLSFQTTGDLIKVVPNKVHFFHFIDKHPSDEGNNNQKVEDLNFVSATCILAAAFNQQPEQIFIHTNSNVTFNLANKKYWSLVFRVLGFHSPKQQQHDKKYIGTRKKSKTILKVVHLKQPTHVFGQPLSSSFHATDVARLNVLIREGGIALDQDTFIVRKLDPSFFNEDTKVTIGSNI